MIFNFGMSFVLLLFIGSYLKVTNCKTNILIMFETELDKVQKLTLLHFHSNNQVLFEHGHQESCQLNLALIWACMYSQHLILNLGYLLPSTSHCFHNQIRDYLCFHRQLIKSLHFGIFFDQYNESVCQVCESNSMASCWLQMLMLMLMLFWCSWTFNVFF